MQLKRLIRLTFAHIDGDRPLYIKPERVVVVEDGARVLDPRVRAVVVLEIGDKEVPYAVRESGEQVAILLERWWAEQEAKQ